MERNAPYFLYFFFIFFVFVRSSLVLSAFTHVATRARYFHITAPPFGRSVRVRVYQNALAISNEISNNVSNVVSMHNRRQIGRKNETEKYNAFLTRSLTRSIARCKMFACGVFGGVCLYVYVFTVFIAGVHPHQYRHSNASTRRRRGRETFVIVLLGISNFPSSRVCRVHKTVFLLFIYFDLNLCNNNNNNFVYRRNTLTLELTRTTIEKQ